MALVTQLRFLCPYRRRMAHTGLHLPRKSIHTDRFNRLTRVNPSTLYTDIFMVSRMAGRSPLRPICRLN